MWKLVACIVPLAFVVAAAYLVTKCVALAGIVAFCGLAVFVMILFSRGGDDSFEARYSNRPVPVYTYRRPPESFPVAAPLRLPDGVRPVLEMLPSRTFSRSPYAREGVLPDGRLVRTGHNGGMGGPSYYVCVAGETHGAESWTHVQLTIGRLFPGLKVTWSLTEEQREFEEAKCRGRVGMGKLDPRVPDEWKWGWD